MMPSMRCLFRSVILIALCFAGLLAQAAPAVSLRINCIPSVFLPPGVCFQHTVGQPFTFWVVALDSASGLATNYTGTVSITSSDATATLPPPHTFTPADGSIFGFTMTINSLPAGGANPALVSVTATDAGGLTGSGNFLMTTLPPEPIPALSPGLIAVLALLLGAVGYFNLRKRPAWSRNNRR